MCFWGSKQLFDKDIVENLYKFKSYDTRKLVRDRKVDKTTSTT